ncbi:hypothetical protein GGI42DRAFT_95339 [Trichoderma sp. SZMC 28013]
MGSVGSVDSASPHKPAKEARKLACRLCQKRKKKCNRKSPCSMCIKVRHPILSAQPVKIRQRQTAADIFPLQQTPAQSRLSAKRTSRAAQTQAVNKGLVCPAGLVRRAAAA